MISTGEEQVRHEASRRWPTPDQEVKYFELNTAKDKPRGGGRSKIKPPARPFALLESIDPKVLDKLLTASSLKLKRVRRYPGWILQHTYNLKNRPIQII